VEQIVGVYGVPPQDSGPKGGATRVIHPGRLVVRRSGGDARGSCVRPGRVPDCSTTNCTG
jgi:hypothetical protein